MEPVHRRSATLRSIGLVLAGAICLAVAFTLPSGSKGFVAALGVVSLALGAAFGYAAYRNGNSLP